MEWLTNLIFALILAGVLYSVFTWLRRRKKAINTPDRDELVVDEIYRQKNTLINVEWTDPHRNTEHTIRMSEWDSIHVWPKMPLMAKRDAVERVPMKDTQVIEVDGEMVRANKPGTTKLGKANAKTHVKGFRPGKRPKNR
jgi:hypothetical protein